MFNRDDKSLKDTETVVGASVIVRGDFQGKGNIIIEGSLEGSLTTEGSLFAGEKSSITANIKAKEAKILGSVKGDIALAGQLELGPQANIQGNIKVGGLLVAAGAIVNGQISMSNSFSKDSANSDQTPA
jgi:cytoskeletal protein CcmA (bactofilin family)